MKKFMLKGPFLQFRLIYVSLSILFFPGTVFPEEVEDFPMVKVLPEEVYQGDICVIDIFHSEPFQLLTAKFQNKELSFYRIEERKVFRTLVGIDMQAKTERHKLTVTITDESGNTIEKGYGIRILKKDFGVQELTLPRRMVELDKKTLMRVNKENKSVKIIWPKETKNRLWDKEFIKPLDGKIISPFGVKRILNGLPRSPHSGIDLKGKTGEKIRCSNTGIIVFAQEMYFSGKTVITDHGQGLYTMYFHLSRIDVNKGQRVERGEVLGLVGSTGRATGPHLHWGVRLHGARVDPVSLLRLKD